ncbi:HAD family hydrolase [Luteibaculum oceani]|uniref:HAD-IA family hydrolase n=1 Tax=Luteibaculum oceani TaxID=1294296 RepID=A0A5C6VNQ5_9FLAO|nr:HAD-IA family hydrolase [Luteibaculum oceani]TXC85265.1 HAD-IA family hydrolase [Luteibaculum oceani]
MYSFQKDRIKIFDLGGVIINIHPPLTFNAMKDRLHPSRDPALAEAHFQKLFTKFEIGSFDRLALLEQINPWLNQQLKYPEFEKIWNELLLDVPKHRLQCLLKLKEKEEIYLLSNTNEIHIQAINQYLRNEFGVDGLEAIFTKCFLSYEMNQRKPDASIYQSAMRQIPGNADSYIFFDDTFENVEGSNSAGLPAVHVPNEKNKEFWDYLCSQ